MENTIEFWNGSPDEKIAILENQIQTLEKCVKLILKSMQDYETILTVLTDQVFPDEDDDEKLWTIDDILSE
jgi:hypothetical protein